MKSKRPQIKMLNRTTDNYRQHLAEHLLANQRRKVDLCDTSAFQRGIDRMTVQENLDRQVDMENSQIQIDGK